MCTSTKLFLFYVLKATLDIRTTHQGIMVSRNPPCSLQTLRTTSQMSCLQAQSPAPPIRQWGWRSSLLIELLARLILNIIPGPQARRIHRIRPQIRHRAPKRIPALLINLLRPVLQPLLRRMPAKGALTRRRHAPLLLTDQATHAPTLRRRGLRGAAGS